MADRSNIETFNTLAALVFEQLYEEFPVPVMLDNDEIAQSLGVQGYRVREAPGFPGSKIVTDYGELLDGSSFWQFYQAALTWLQDEGLVREPEDRHFVLTSAALTALNAQPDALKEPLGKRLQGVAGKATSEAGRAAIAEAVGQVIGVAFRHFLGGST